jgi:hypothetical protein
VTTSAQLASAASRHAQRSSIPRGNLPNGVLTWAALVAFEAINAIFAVFALLALMSRWT